MKKIVAELQGGLGNQLFILGAGMSTAEKFSCGLELDARSLSNPNERSIAIEPVLELLTNQVALITGVRPLPERIKRLLSIKLKSSKYFIERDFGYDPRFNSISQKQVLSGYFQSPKYLSESVKQRLFYALEQVRIANEVDLSTSIHIHIRRGDYLSTSASSIHGLASMDYFERSIQLVQNELPNATFKVFTDSPELLTQQQLTRWNATLETGQTSQTPLESLIEMGAGAGLIMSNSSFSWWAAWMMAQRNSASPIIAPRPWMANGDSAHELLLPDWITLGSR